MYNARSRKEIGSAWRWNASTKRATLPLPTQLLCRQRLPKGVDLAAPVQGMDSRMRLTGSRGGTASGGRCNPQFVDANTPGTFYHWSELLPGTDFNLLGRKAHVVGFANVPSERFVRNQLPSAMVSAAARRSRPSVRACSASLYILPFS